jgi:N-acetylglucosaminyl-diphospho-decaprenol L-rhamnosyltransferase
LASKAFDHFVITRFNVVDTYINNNTENRIRLSPGWLEERIDLFERYCFPTVAGQTDKDFIWLIYLDIETPAAHKSRIETLCATLPAARIQYCATYDIDLIRSDIIRLASPGCNWLVTTRLDNDDGLGSRFMEDLHATVVPGSKEAISFTNGLIACEGRYYLSRQKSNAFLSLSEPFQDFTTVLVRRHNAMMSYATVREIEHAPAWMQVIHGRNVSNKVRGWRIPFGKLPAGFEAVGFPGGGDNKGDLAILGENLTLGFLRQVRDGLAAASRIFRRPDKF